MSQRILPPVRISFVADTKQFNKASDEVLKKVQKVADSATKIQSVSAGAASIKMATQTAVGLIQRQLTYAAQQLVSTVHTVRSGSVRTQVVGAVHTARTAIGTAITDMAANLGPISASSSSTTTAMRNALRAIIGHVNQHLTNMVATLATMTVGTGTLHNNARNALRAIIGHLNQHLVNMVAGLSTVTVSAGTLNNNARTALRTIVTHLNQHIVNMVAGLGTVTVGTGPLRDSVLNALRHIIVHMNRILINMVSGLSTLVVTSSNLRQAVRDAIRIGSQAIATVVQATFTAAATSLSGQAIYVPQVTTRLQSTLRQVLQVLLRIIHNTLMAGARNIRGQAQVYFRLFSQQVGTAVGNMVTRLTRSAVSQINRTRARAGNIPPVTGGGGGGGFGRGGGGGGGGGFDMGARADIFMHMRALQTMQRYSASIFETYMNYQDLTVAIGAFAGGATSAAKIMKEIQDYAIASPYDTLTLAEGARDMMAYGQSADKTMKIMKMVGDVAGGSAKRYDLLMYAMSQITSLGKLQGNELRQLTEQGFNPLVYWAERTQGANESMEDAMRRMYKAKAAGLITSEHVIEALEAETSAGGRFHRLAERLNDSLRGLSNQVRETGVKISIMFLKYVEPNAKRFLKTILEVQKRVVSFMEDPANNMLVAQLAQVAQAAFLTTAGIFVFGFALASLRWFMYAGAKILRGALYPAMLLYRGVVILTNASMAMLNVSMVVLRYSFYASVAAGYVLRGAFIGAAFAAQGLSATMFALATASRVVRSVTSALIVRVVLWYTALYTARGAVMMFNIAMMVQRGLMIALLSFVYAATIAYGAFAAASYAVRGATIANTAAIALARAGMVALNAVVATTRLGWLRMLIALVMTAAAALFQATAVATLSAQWVLATVAVRAFQVAGWAARGVMVALRIAAALAWLAALGPVALVIAAIGAVALAIWSVISLVSSPGGLTGAFTRAWESVKWFSTAAQGFMSNFGENMGIITQYVSDNWYAMVTDLGRMFLGVMSAMPGNLLVALRTGMRLISAFGGWVGSWLPGAFQTAYNKIYEFLTDFFINLISISKKVWEYMTTPSQWGNTQIEKDITAFMDTLRDDANSAAVNGLGTAMTDILTEEMANLRTGLEGFSSSLPPIDLNLTPAPIELPPGIEEDPMKIYRDFGGMFNPFEGEDKGKGGVKDITLPNAMSATSGEYNKFIAEWSMRQQGTPTGEAPQVGEQKKTNGKLDKILGAIRGGGVMLPANVGGVR